VGVKMEISVVQMRGRTGVASKMVGETSFVMEIDYFEFVDGRVQFCGSWLVWEGIACRYW